MYHDECGTCVKFILQGFAIMTFDEFVPFRDVKIKNENHERVVKAFYVYLQSVTGNSRLLPNEIGRILNIDTSSSTIETGCFNGIFDGTDSPYDDVDFYVKSDNEIFVFIYGRIPIEPLKKLRENEYVIFMLSSDLNGTIERNNDGHVYIR